MKTIFLTGGTGYIGSRLTRRKAKALGLVTVGQMLNALVMVIEQPEKVGEVLGVPEISAYSTD